MLLIRFPLQFLFIFLFLSCNTTAHNEKGVEAAMKKYDRLIKKMDATAIAMLYTPDGDLGEMAHGRDSIKKFLATFKNVRVLAQSSTTSSISINGDSSFQKGTYRQMVLINGKDTVKVKGEYTAHWLWVSGQGWLIKHMATKPMN